MNQIPESVDLNLDITSHQNVPLSATELSNLWTSCLTYSLLTKVFTYFASQVFDLETKSLMERTAQICNNRQEHTTSLLNQAGRVAPAGFTGKDVILGAPRLYEDTFYLFYLRNMIKIQLPTNTMFLTTSARADVRQMYQRFIIESMDVFDQTTDLMLSKGILIRSPHIPTVNKVDFVKQQSFMTGFMGEKRPLLALEISSLHYLVWTNYVGKSLLMGFRQVAKMESVRDYLDQGIQLASKLMANYGGILAQEEIPQPMFWDAMVTDSKVSPFSDRLMVSHTVVLNAAGLQNIGAALSTSLRRDISTQYLKTLADIMSYAEDGTNLMIANGWLEEAPRHIDREMISRVKH